MRRTAAPATTVAQNPAEGCLRDCVIVTFNQNELANLLTYFKCRLTNAFSESLNSKIQWVKYAARGFRNFDNFATAIYFHCGGLDMTPLPT
jgi:hypothetical protein